MTTVARETSAFAGEPIWLFDFVIGTQHYRYTTAETAQTYNFQTWQPAAIERARKQISDRLDDARMDITCDRELDIVLRLRAPPLPTPCRVVIYKSHRGETDWIQDWAGIVTRTSLGEAEATLRCSAEIALNNVQSHRLYFSTTCPYVVYDEFCQVDRQLFRTVGTVSAISGLDVTIPEVDALADGRFTGGMLEWNHPTDGAMERRWIASHAGAVLALVERTGSLAVGMNVSVYWGCDRSKDSAFGCLGFNNVINFGGEPYIPPDNPFNGKTLF
ncbi:MAG: phage BR0599 family protein [Hyphomicrobiaceae bacterium]